MTIAYARRIAGVKPSAIRELLRLGADPEVISFGGGYPDPALFPITELQEIYADLLVAERADSLQYTASNGLPALRTQVADRLGRDGIDCTAEDVLIIQGGQQGLDLAAKLVVDPGDLIITENPTFLGALIAFAPTEPRYAAVRTDDDGMDTEHLAEVLAEHPDAKLIYTVPDFQNPTGVTLSLARRRRLIELANTYGLLVVEDTEGRVLHLGSFSKILAPSMRLGWAVAAPEILEPLALLKLAADTQNSTLNMHATSQYLRRHDIDAHLRATNPVYRHKRDLMLATIEDCFPDDVGHTMPQGGLFTWLTFPAGFDAARFMAETLLPEVKVAFVPGATFFPVRQEPNHARMSYSGVPDERLVHGVRELGRLLARELVRTPG